MAFTLKLTFKAVNMFKLLLPVALLACAAAAPRPGSDADTQITKFASNQELDGSYAFDIQKSDSSAFAEQGQGGISAQGYYSYISPEGIPIAVSYVADENGFRPQSDVLPTPPPIPEEILRALRYIEEHPTPEELADREVRKHQF